MIEKGTERQVRLIGNWIDELGNKFEGRKTIKISVQLE